MWCCGAGAPTSSPACPAWPSSTRAPLPGGRSSDGCAANTAGSPGRISAAATATVGGGPLTARSSCSIPAWSAPLATATGEQPSPRRGRLGDEEPRHAVIGLVESPVPGRLARRVREAGRGNPSVETPTGRPGPTSLPHTAWSTDLQFVPVLTSLLRRSHGVLSSPAELAFAIRHRAPFADHRGPYRRSGPVRSPPERSSGLPFTPSAPPP